MKTREERQALRAIMPLTPLSAHHMENARLLPDRGELLYRIPNGVIGVEVGAAFGEYTALMRFDGKVGAAGTDDNR
ncbi:hypothetical protein AB9E13_34225, partial [Rhizobium leguminosarum]